MLKTAPMGGRIFIAVVVTIVSVFSCVVALANQPSWALAIAVFLEAMVVAAFCYVVLRRTP